MSVINKVLQELDRRNAAGPVEPGPQPVKPVGTARGGHEWFWRIIAVLVLISLAWIAWVAYQLQPRSIVTPAGLAAGRQAPAPQAAQVAPQPAPPAVEPVKAPEPIKAPEPEQAAKAPEPAKPAPEPVETFRLARSIETPIPAPKPEAKKPEAKKAEPKVVQVLPEKTLVDKRVREKAVDEKAEAYFRRAAAFLQQGRVSEAEAQLAAALKADASHVPARQAYVALLLEQQRVNGALYLLREAVDANPSQPAFSLALARVYAEQRNYPAALDVMEKAGPVAHGPDFQVLRAAVLQRQGRHAEAVNAYQNAVQLSAQPGSTWTGLGISLEALGRHAEAAEAYRRALGAGPMTAELRDYTESRIRALK